MCKEWSLTYNPSHSYSNIQMGTILVSIILMPDMYNR